MGSEAFCRRVVLPALGAAEGFLLRVAELVFLQVTHLEELLPTAGASVPPLSDLRLPRKSRRPRDLHGGLRLQRRRRLLCEARAGVLLQVGRSLPAARRTVNASRFRRQAGAAADRGRLGDATETPETPEIPEIPETRLCVSGFSVCPSVCGSRDAVRVTVPRVLGPLGPPAVGWTIPLCASGPLFLRLLLFLLLLFLLFLMSFHRLQSDRDVRFVLQLHLCPTEKITF